MMKSNFLNLPSSASGDARRHVPFRSIINKHFSFIFVLVFVFSILFSYVHPVAALADPVFEPVIDTQFYQIPQAFNNLTPVQQDIFYFTLGSQMVEYSGLSGYRLDDPYSDPDDVAEWFKHIGIKLYNDVIESFQIVGQPIITAGSWVKDLFSNFLGVCNFAGYFNNTSWNDFLHQVNSDGLSLQLYPSMFGALNQFLANNNGLYNWQISSSPFVSELSWSTGYLTQSQESQYLNWLSNNPYNVRVNQGFYNNRFGSNMLSTYHNLFINTSEHRCYVANDNGNLAGGTYWFNEIWLSSNTLFERTGRSFDFIDYKSYSTSYYSNLVDVARDYFNNSLNGSSSSYQCFYSDFIDTVYYGTTWSNKQVLTNSDDLNFSQNNSQSTDMPIIETLLDIKGLIQDLLETNDLKAPALDNLTLPNGDPLPASQIQPVSVAIELPDSGIDIPNDLFSPLTKEGGYISYLWFMTKPLVQYTSDFVQTMVFDGTEDFDITGPGAIVFGVISLGLIGGLVVKCLL